jgi:glycine cleavage system protein P-like pyridoxal-binding family
MNAPVQSGQIERWPVVSLEESFDLAVAAHGRLCQLSRTKPTLGIKGSDVAKSGLLHFSQHAPTCIWQ